MNYETMFFSPTGGTDKVTAMLTSHWGKAERSVDLTNNEMDFSSIAFQAEDVAVIAVPSYGGRVPGLAAERIQQVHGNGARAVLVCAYGNRAYEDTLAELEDLATTAGFQVTAAGGGLAPQTEDTCIQCGQCAARCPAGAIDPADAGKVDASKCIGCMRCVAICPQHAKALDASKLAGIEAMLEKTCSGRKPCELY